MELTLPVYVEVRRQDGHPVHFCRPLFFAGPQTRDSQLGLAMSRLSRELKPQLDALGGDLRHDALYPWAFSPPLETHLLKLQILLRDRVVRLKLLFVIFSAFERRIAFSPSLPELWFEVMPGEKLLDRATEIVTQHLRGAQKRHRRGGEANTAGQLTGLQGQAWVTTIDMHVDTKGMSAKKLERQLASLFEEGPVDGGIELSRVGRCLNWLYPNELHRAVERGEEVERLLRKLDSLDNRPVVLVGPRLSGKTTVLHEVVWQRVLQQKKPFAAKRNLWLLSPQRLISGMMYVGQWEGRVQAILREARKRRHILYFDDFLGLYQAGISREAHLSVAEMIKPYIVRREVRVLAEMTPEVFQAFQERDRGMADQFDVVRIEAMGEEATRRVMLSVHRDLEAKHRSIFDLDALPTILQLHRSYLRDAAFPGKSAAFSRQLTQKHPHSAITRHTVYTEFHQKTGLSIALVDDRRRLDRDDVVNQLRKKIVAQDEAVQAAADVVSIAKAKLAAPERPLATLLFLGPTGVGKTQCAKTLAEVMFGDPSRLLRFDMNEFVTPHAVGQLVGTFFEPDGLLTSAVRRQPFAVVLLDEIEKAHHDVFDLLLQVTGEGRLTDALGQTADFSNTVVIMTSNLGTTATNQQLGLVPTPTTRRQSFVKAAESFFRPEFFNRIDRVIPFDPLSRDEMRKIADLTLVDVFQRDGLVRRRCALAVEPAAMERIIDAGYHPQFGARALKRAIERQLVQPVAAELAGIKPELPAIISLYPHVDGIATAVHSLESVPLSEQSLYNELTPEDQLSRVDRFVERATNQLETLRPGSHHGRGVSGQQVFYFAVKEQLHQVRSLLDAAQDTIAMVSKSPVSPVFAPRHTSYRNRIAGGNYRDIPERRILREIQAADDIHHYLREQAVDMPKPGALLEQLTELRYQAVVLDAMLSSSEQPQNGLLLVRPVSTAAVVAGNILYTMLASLFRNELGLAWTEVPCEPGWHAAEISGAGAMRLLSAEAGIHVWCHFHEVLLPISVRIVPGTPQSASQQVEMIQTQRREWLAELAAGRSSADHDPWPLGNMVRIYDEDGPTLDFRTGVTLTTIPQPAVLKQLVLAGLPLPPEMELSS